jgi:hypothetical protein
VLRTVSGPKSEEVAGGWRRLHNEELHKFYASPDIGRFITHICESWKLSRYSAGLRAGRSGFQGSIPGGG